MHGVQSVGSVVWGAELTCDRKGLHIVIAIFWVESAWGFCRGMGAGYRVGVKRVIANMEDTCQENQDRKTSKLER